MRHHGILYAQVLAVCLVCMMRFAVSQGCNIRQDTDYGAAGSEFKTIKGTRGPMACCSACSSDTRCSYWVRCQGSGDCHLKQDEGLEVFFSRLGYDSGSSRSAGCFISRNKDYGTGGAEFKTVKFTEDIAACCDACTAERRCAYWVRAKNNGDCYLKAEEGENNFSNDPDFDSGASRVKGCGVKRSTKYGFGGAEVADPVKGTSTLAECCDACTAEIRCQYWARRKDSGDCYLTGDEGPVSFFPDNGSDSGISRMS